MRSVLFLAALAVANPEPPFPWRVEWNLNSPCELSGFFSELVTVLLELEPLVKSLSLRMGTCSDAFLDEMLPPRHGQLIRRLQRRHAILAQIAALQEGNEQPKYVAIHHWHACAAERYDASSRPRAVVVRHMSEGTRLHPDAVRCCAANDEIWVPTRWHADIYSQAGLSKVAVLPNAVDTDFFQPAEGAIAAAACRGHEAVSFVSVFKWELNKGYDVLLDAYWDEFRRDEGTVLRIVSFRQAHDTRTAHSLDDAIAAHAASRAGGGDVDTLARVEWVRSPSTGKPVLSRHELREAVRESDCFVLPTRGEGFNLPTAEAMAMGKPTIATNFSGPTDFMSPLNALPLAVESIRSDGLAEPSRAHLRQLLRQVYDETRAKNDTAPLAERSARARADIEARFHPAVVAQQVLARLRHITKDW